VVVVTTAAQPVAVAGVDPNRPLDRAADADEALDVLALVALGPSCRTTRAPKIRHIRYLAAMVRSYSSSSSVTLHLWRPAMAVPLASWCALRFGEMIELRRGDIDLDAEVIHIRRAVVRVKGGYMVGEPKSQAGIRDVAIPPHVVTMIRDHLAEHVGPRSDALLFPSVPAGTKHLSMTALYRAWGNARVEAGRKDLRWHDPWHSGAVLAAATGASLAELMARLGHSTAKAALIYQHVARTGPGNSGPAVQARRLLT
jgi:integrase